MTQAQQIRQAAFKAAGCNSFPLHYQRDKWAVIAAHMQAAGCRVERVNVSTFGSTPGQTRAAWVAPDGSRVWAK